MGNREEHPQCLVERAVNDALASAFDEAEALLIERFKDVTLADLSAHFSHEYALTKRTKDTKELLMHIPHPKTEFDVIVVGGSYAGLSAATQLARARRRVLVVDAGQRRNRYARHSHGFLGQDGREAAAIVADARVQLLKYPTVRWLEGTATQAARTEQGFRVALQDGSAFQALRLVLATGVVDELPPIPGLAERWGSSAFHCPYCHGYELMQGAIGVLATGPMSMHHAMMLPDWGQVTLFLNGAFEPDAGATGVAEGARRDDRARRGEKPSAATQSSSWRMDASWRWRGCSC